MAGRLPIVVALLLASVDALAQKAAAPDVVAVFDIEGQGVAQFDPRRAGKFTDVLETVVASSGYQTVPRAAIRERIIAQQGESYRPCFDESCQIELGKAVAAQKAISTRWAQFDSICTLTLRVWDLKSETTEFSTKADRQCSERGLRAAIEEVGRALKARAHRGVGTFSLDLEAGSKIKNPPTDEHGYLKIKAEAKGRPGQQIEVWINGANAGSVANGLFMKELPCGYYLVLLRSAGDLFAHQRFEIHMKPEGVELPKLGLIQLKPLFGTLVIAGSPKTATALINGEPRSIQEILREDRKIGTYTIRVEAPGYLASEAKQVTVEPGAELDFAYALVRNAGSISVTASPEGAEVLLDGVASGHVPLTLTEVDAGDRVVEVRASGHHPARSLVTVGPGTQASVSIQLEAKVARLKVEAVADLLGAKNQIEAEVYVDGHKVGVTPWKGPVLAEVRHTLQLRLGPRKTDERFIELPEGVEKLEIVETPGAWAGAIASVEFNLGDGPWQIRSGGAALSSTRPNPVRPGTIPVELFLRDTKVGEGTVTVAADETRVVRVTSRPKLEDELDSSQRSWEARKWTSAGLSVLALAVATGGFVSATDAASDRDRAFAALRTTTVPEELDSFRQVVVDKDDERSTSESVAAAALGAGVVLAAWTAYEWIFGEPRAGSLEVIGLDKETR